MQLGQYGKECVMTYEKQENQITIGLNLTTKQSSGRRTRTMDSQVEEKMRRCLSRERLRMISRDLSYSSASMRAECPENAKYVKKLGKFIGKNNSLTEKRLDVGGGIVVWVDGVFLQQVVRGD